MGVRISHGRALRQRAGLARDQRDDEKSNHADV
jgi:hypothetical protein